MGDRMSMRLTGLFAAHSQGMLRWALKLTRLLRRALNMLHIGGSKRFPIAHCSALLYLVQGFFCNWIMQKSVALGSHPSLGPPRHSDFHPCIGMATIPPHPEYNCRMCWCERCVEPRRSDKTCLKSCATHLGAP